MSNQKRRPWREPCRLSAQPGVRQTLRSGCRLGPASWLSVLVPEHSVHRNRDSQRSSASRGARPRYADAPETARPRCSRSEMLYVWLELCGEGGIEEREHDAALRYGEVPWIRTSGTLGFLAFLWCSLATVNRKRIEKGCFRWIEERVPEIEGRGPATEQWRETRSRRGRGDNAPLPRSRFQTRMMRRSAGELSCLHRTGT